MQGLCTDSRMRLRFLTVRFLVYWCQSVVDLNEKLLGNHQQPTFDEINAYSLDD